MYKINEDLSIYVTRGDIVIMSVKADFKGKPYTFQSGDLVRFKVFKKKNCADVALEKDFPITTATQNVQIFLSGEDTKIGDVISKPVDYWYEVELNPTSDPQTIIGYDEDGAKVFKLFPEGADKELEDYETDEEELLSRYMDDELDLSSKHPVENQAIARAIAQLKGSHEETHKAVAEMHVTPQMYGAIGDGVSDDTEALKRAAEYCAANNAILHIPVGSYVINESIDMRYIDIDICGTIIIANHGVGLLVGDRSDNASRRIIKIARVTHQNYTDGDISVRIVGLMNGELSIGIAKHVQLYADGDSEHSAISYSDFHIGKCDYLQIVDRAGTSNIGWINENTFYNCRVMVKFSIEGNTYTHNNNVFYKPCFENASVVLSNCTRNKFYDIRTEGKFSMTLDEKTSLNLVEYNFYYTFPFIANNILGITDNGVNNTVINSTFRDMESVLVYSMSAPSVNKNLYEIGAAKSSISTSGDVVTIAKQWGAIITDAIIPVKGIRFLRANADAGAFRFTFTPLDANKQVMKNAPLVQDGNGDGQKSDGSYNIQNDSWGATIAIINPDVAYIKLGISTGSSQTSFSFTNLSLWAYYHPYDFRRPAILADFFKSAIPTT